MERADQPQEHRTTPVPTGRAGGRHASRHASEERLRIAQEAAGLGIHDYDVPSGAIMWDARVRELWGVEPDEPISYEVFLAGVHPDDRAATEAAIQRALDPAGDGDYYAEYRVIHRTDGRTRWVAATGKVTFAAGDPVRLVGTVQNITARKDAEAERERLLAQVARHAAELDATLSAIADGLIIYGLDGRVVRMNAAADRILRYRPEERGLAVPERVGALALTRADGTPYRPEETPAMRALAGEEIAGEVMVAHRPHGTVWMSVSAAPIRTPDGVTVGAVVTFTDITALHELQHQQELLMHMVSHDLRVPLTALHGHVDLLGDALAEARTGDAARASLEVMGRSVRRLDLMIDDLVDAARVAGRTITLAREPVEFAPFVHELLRRSAAALAVGRVRVHVAPGLPPLSADPHRLERVVVNLLTNALKYSTPDTPVLLCAWRGEAEAVVAITDQGPGIPPDEAAHVFDRFYRASSGRHATGTGLGLYITRLLIEAHGGTIRMKSEVGKGSTVSFTVPLAG